MQTVQMQLQPLTCPSCVVKIERALKGRPGVEEVEVLFNAGKVRVRFHESQVTTASLVEVLANLGYPVLGVR